MEAFFVRLTAAGPIRARHEPNAQSSPETDLQRGHDHADAWHLQVRDHDEILLWLRVRAEERAHPTADRQSPRGFIEGIEEKSRQGVDASARSVDVVSSRYATGSVDLESRVISERHVYTGARVERTRCLGAHIYGIHAQLERRHGSPRRLLCRRARERREREEWKNERENLDARAQSVHGARKLGVDLGAFQRALAPSVRAT